MAANHYLIIICFEESVGKRRKEIREKKGGRGSSDFKNSEANVCLRKEGKAVFSYLQISMAIFTNQTWLF